MCVWGNYGTVYFSSLSGFKVGICVQGLEQSFAVLCSEVKTAPCHIQVLFLKNAILLIAFSFSSATRSIQYVFFFFLVQACIFIFTWNRIYKVTVLTFSLTINSRHFDIRSCFWLSVSKSVSIILYPWLSWDKGEVFSGKWVHLLSCWEFDSMSLSHLYAVLTIVAVFTTLCSSSYYFSFS